MPEGIFGPKTQYTCRLCNYVSSRPENLEVHHRSTAHIEKLSSQGSRKASNQLEDLNEAKFVATQMRKKEAKIKLDNERAQFIANCPPDDQALFDSSERPSTSRALEQSPLETLNDNPASSVSSVNNSDTSNSLIVASNTAENQNSSDHSDALVLNSMARRAQSLIPADQNKIFSAMVRSISDSFNNVILSDIPLKKIRKE